MGTGIPLLGQKALKEKVLDNGLCTYCGACINLCPYAVAYKDRTIIMDTCKRDQGRCYAFCPRTLTDLQPLQEQLFHPQDIHPELGAMKGFYVTRAADPAIRQGAQHGGTVTALLSLALEAGLIDTAIVADEGDHLLPSAVAAQQPAEIRQRAKSKFVATPILAIFNQAAKEGPEKIGVVATPCQALALAKMRSKPIAAQDSAIDKLRLVIGLFCGWALSWRELRRLLEAKIGETAVLGLDIPPSKHHSLEVHTPEGTLEINLDEVFPAVRTACRYCLDLTAEFADISVGSARLPEGWKVARGWNQVIVRTVRGMELLELARSQAVLEFRDIPDGNLERLKKASWNKKKNALKNLAEKSGKADDLIYLNFHDPALRLVLGRGNDGLEASRAKG